MARKRAQLMSMFPEGTLSAEQASEALRKSKGDVEQAKQSVLANQENENLPMTAKLKQENQTSKAVISKDKEIRPSSKGSPAVLKEDQERASNSSDADRESVPPTEDRRPPRQAVAINNLSDRQYCCVWWIEESKDAYRPDIARSLLARVARHVNPILRERGWRVKRLLESFSPRFAGVCYTNGWTMRMPPVPISCSISALNPVVLVVNFEPFTKSWQ